MMNVFVPHSFSCKKMTKSCMPEFFSNVEEEICKNLYHLALYIHTSFCMSYKIISSLLDSMILPTQHSYSNQCAGTTKLNMGLAGEGS